MLNLKENKPHKVIENCLDSRWSTGIFNHFDSPLHFMDDIIEWRGVFPDGRVNEYIDKGIKEYENISSLDINYSTLYKDVEEKVKNKLIARGFATSLLYQSVEFTTEKTGALSKQRAMLGKKDCYFKDSTFNDSKLFHDIYINLSYDSSVSDNTIRDNSYALYALTKALARVIPIRVFVVNHVGTNTPSCYSYVLKKYGMVMSPEEFLFFTSASKRTFGFAMYDILNNGYKNVAKTGNPKNTVSIANFSLDKEIDSIITVLKQDKKFKGLKNEQPE